MRDYVSSTERVGVRLDATTLHIVFNHPERYNALSVDMWGALPPLLEQAASDDRVRLVVFTGAGDKAFVSGADISQFEDLRAARDAVAKYESLAETALMAIQQCPVPTLACVRGFCVGGGVNVAVACDLRIASDDSVFFVPAARLGLGYRHSAMKNLVQLIGPGAAKDLFFTARRVSAAEALTLGLVNRIAPRTGLDALLDEYVTALADNAPLTIRAAKFVVSEVLKAPSELDLEQCRTLIRSCFESDDYAEGRRAFMEKRKPVFKGK